MCRSRPSSFHSRSNIERTIFPINMGNSEWGIAKKGKAKRQKPDVRIVEKAALIIELEELKVLLASMRTDVKSELNEMRDSFSKSVVEMDKKESGHLWACVSF